VSLALFVVGLRHLGTARTGAYFSTAPFLGAIVAVVALGEPVTVTLIAAGVLMAASVWLHVTEHHEHEHVHETLMHAHAHVHDEHHQHPHLPEDPPANLTPIRIVMAGSSTRIRMCPTCTISTGTEPTA
jgi:hypothetical protein